jgi:pyruvate kinase
MPGPDGTDPVTRTCIVVTLGPAADRPGVLEGMLAAGLDVARINLSHGAAVEHIDRVRRVREAARAGGYNVAVLADLPGPKLRVVLAGPFTLAVGREVTLAAEPAAADVRLTEPEPIRDAMPGHRILMDDGRFLLRVVRADRGRLVARVEVGGTLLPNKGLNLPDTPLSIPSLTARDREALAVVAEAGADWLALSFVREPQAADALRTAAREAGLDLPVLAKVERPEAVERAAEIVAAFDGVMVARGDLGVEIPLERVPHVQKALIALARAAGKPVVTATEMLDSMRANPRPTRAEVADVANAIYDGTDAVMLSGETSVGEYPVEAVATMERIARETEAHLTFDGARDVLVPRGEVDDHVTHTICDLAREVGAAAIVAPTYSGRTARLLARHRPRTAIVAAARSEAVVRRLAMVWGVSPVLLPATLTAGEDRLQAAVRAAFVHGAVRSGDTVVAVAGHPVEGGDRFPTIRVVRVGAQGNSVAP